MRWLLLTLLSLTHAANARTWEEIDKLVGEQKIQAALDKTLEIKKNASADPRLFTEALVRATQLQIGLHGYEKAVRALRDEKWPSDPESRVLLNLYYTHALLLYNQQYSYEIRQRELTVASETVDLKAWTSAQINGEIARAFDTIMNEGSVLAKPSPEYFKSFIEKGTYPKEIRPNLRDLVVYEAVRFIADSSHWTPAESNESYLVPVAELAARPPTKRIPLGRTDSHPLRKVASWLGEHAASHRGNGGAELEARYVLFETFHMAVNESDDREALIKALRELQKSGRSDPWWARGQAILGQFLSEAGNKVAAREELVAGRNAYPRSPGGLMCVAQIEAIEAPGYTLMTMESDAAARRSLKLEYRNLKKMYFRAYSIDVEAGLKQKEAGGDPLRHIFQPWRDRPGLRGPKPEAEWSVDLPETKDYDFHRFFVTPPLKKAGAYAIAASARADFAPDNNQVNGVPFILTDLVLLTKSNNDGTIEIRALSGEKGAPVKGADIKLYRYDYRKPAQIAAQVSTDARGYALIQDPNKGSYWNNFVLARAGANLALSRDSIYFGGREARPRIERSLIFTDRSIYRPQQKIAWKIAAYLGAQEKGELRTATKGTAIQVALYDPNGQRVATKDVKVGAYGSASGEFTIPAGRPLGDWRLAVDGPYNSSSSIKVEEYKRPTFEAELKAPVQKLRLNKNAIVTGNAKYYFGLPVSAGLVKWRVTRQEYRPFWWSEYSWFYPPPQTNEQTIASGEAKLRPDGTFEISFLPAADARGAKQDTPPAYTFSVSADITDEGGETRSATRAFRVGFVELEARIELPSGFIPEKKPFAIPVKLGNLDGEPSKGKGSYRVVRLQGPAAAVLPADLPRASGEQPSGFKTPDDARRARWETRVPWRQVTSEWKEDEVVARGTLSHDANGLAEAKLAALPAGIYRMIYEAADDSGAKLKVPQDFLVAGAKAPVPLALLFEAEKTSLEVGDTARVFVHSGLTQQPLTLEIYRDGKMTSRRALKSDEGVIEIPVKAADRGGISLVVYGVRDHQWMREELTIEVPWSDKKLALEFSTFRDRLRPGSKETFRVTVKPSRGAKLGPGGVEILSYMYDRSLDLFGPHAYPNVIELYPRRSGVPNMSSTISYESASYILGNFKTPATAPFFERDKLQFIENYGIGGPGYRMSSRGGPPGMMMDSLSEGESMNAEESVSAAAPPPGGLAPFARGRAMAKKSVGGNQAPEAPESQVRSNFAETSFFYPHLIADKSGTVSFTFTVPDSVTSWKVLAHALTKDMRGGSLARETQSVKELMVRPYVPRFLREGDRAQIKVTVNNSSNSAMSGDLELDIESNASGKSALGAFGLKARDVKKAFKVPKGGSTTLTFAVKAPRSVGDYALKVVAKSKGFSDGERRPFPVLPSRLHLAQSRFAALRGNEKKILEFKDLAVKDETRINEKLVVTLDAQLFYGVLDALPYLIDYPYECVEQTLNRFVSTGIVTSVFKKYPSVAQMAKQMSARKAPLASFNEPDANRRMALEESPWLVESKGGDAGKYALANVLDERVARSERDRALARLAKMQLSDGGFPWFEGGRPDTYMTLYLLMGFGRALEFGVDVPKPMVARAWRFVKTWLDNELARMIREEWGWELVTMVNYTLSQYPDKSWTGGAFDEKYRQRLAAYSFAQWKKHSPLLKGYLALTLKRMKRDQDAKLVFDSVMDSAKTDDELGTYWAQEDRSWLWYNDSIETHAFTLRALKELNGADKRLDGLVQWLFLNKKLSHWKSTRATSEAIYALVHYLDAKGELGGKEKFTISVAGETKKFDFSPEKYTGKKNQVVVPGEKLSPSAQVVVDQQSKGFAFATATWHFSTDILPKEDRGDFFHVSRTYFKRENNGKEWVLKPLVEGTKLQVGDQIEVQLSLRSKHAAEYVHLRDPRGAGFEPEGATSGWRWDLGISRYEETRDSGANYFFERLPVGEYTFKYRLRANMAGVFRVGPAEVQSMYAPEFNAYSAGHTLTVQ